MVAVATHPYAVGWVAVPGPYPVDGWGGCLVFAALGVARGIERVYTNGMGTNTETKTPTHLLTDPSRRDVAAWNRWRKVNPTDAVTINGGGLYSADLAGVNLAGATIREADLRFACLCGANLCGVVFDGPTVMALACLRGARLQGADIRRVDMGGADLVGANFHGARWSTWTCWPIAKLPDEQDHAWFSRDVHRKYAHAIIGAHRSPYDETTVWPDTTRDDTWYYTGPTREDKCGEVPWAQA